MSKRISLVVILLFMCTATFAGCKGGSNEAVKVKNPAEVSTPQSSPKEDIAITIFQSKVEITDQLEKLAGEYAELTGVKVEVWGATGDGYTTQLLGKLVSGEGPTILSAGPGGNETALIGDYLLDLSGAEFAKYVAPNMGVLYKDKLVGIPYGVEGFGLVYNGDVVKPSEVVDFESFKGAMEKIAGDGLQPFSLSSESYFLIGHILNVPFAMQEDPIEFINGLNDGTKKMADNPIFKEWASFMEVIRSNGTNPLEVKYDTQTGDFATGKTAIIHQGNWSYGMFKDYNTDFDMSMMPLPIMGNDKLSVGIPNSWAINNQASKEEIDAALDFLNWLLTSDRGKEYVIKEFGFIPAMTNMESDSLDPLGKAVADYTAKGKTLPWMFANWPAGIVDSDFFPVTQAFFSDDSITGDRFLQLLDEGWENASSKK